MSRAILMLAILMGFQFFSMLSEAKSFIGFKKSPTSTLDDMVDPVTHFLENESRYEIIIGKHPAFYIFPKVQNAAEVKLFLQESQDKKKRLKFIIDVFSLQIISIESFE